MTALDPFDVRRTLRAPALLAAFNAAGVLAPADVHVARRLGELAGEADETVLLAAALAVRAPRLGHVYVDLATIRETVTVDVEEPVDLTALPWPEPGDWLPRVARSPLAGPLQLEGSALYLDRYWREESQVAADLLALAAQAPDERPVAATGGDPEQQRAVERALRRHLTVIAGGPGTGKTTTVARLLVALYERDPGALVALAAPTARAAARLAEAVHDEVGLDVDASTLHRLLGWKPGTHSRFRHDRANRLPHDVVIVDETSMVSLSQMARLLEALRSDARLVLVGDPGQLASVEAGAVLGDIVGPDPGDAVVTLRRPYRYGAGIDELAEAIRRGDADATVAALGAVTWLPVDAAGDDAIEPVREHAIATARAVIDAARAGDGPEALRALGAFRVLCAHRRGPYGVAAWTARIETWLSQAVDGFGGSEWYAGRPLLVTENDYGLKLYNGDTGVVIATGPDRVSAAFERHGGVLELSPTRLAAVDTVYAMTVHKSQGSQFGAVAVLLPGPDSPLLTRELLYTAVTRARRDLILVGSEASIRVAVGRPVARASGLGRRLRSSRTP